MYVKPSLYDPASNQGAGSPNRCLLLTDEMVATYGYYGGIGGNDAFFYWAGGGLPRKSLYGLRKPAELMMFMDSFGPNAWYYTFPNGDFRHPRMAVVGTSNPDGLANVAYADGHCGTERWANVRLAPQGPKYAEFFWDGSVP